MQAVRSKDTGPELQIRRWLHAHGYRFRLHRKDLPGSPDLVFPGRGKIIFIHGCFWHGHDCRRGQRTPKTNTAYWSAKIIRNRERDTAATASLEAAGWRVLTIWECGLRDQEALWSQVTAFLD